MRKIFLCLTLILYPVVKTSACSMPLPAIQQKYLLEEAMALDGFTKALYKELERDHSVVITGIKFNHGLNVNLSNGCIINVFLKYGRPRHPGLCP